MRYPYCWLRNPDCWLLNPYCRLRNPLCWFPCDCTTHTVGCSTLTAGCATHIAEYGRLRFLIAEYGWLRFLIDPPPHTATLHWSCSLSLTWVFFCSLLCPWLFPVVSHFTRHLGKTSCTFSSFWSPLFSTDKNPGFFQTVSI